MYHRTWHNFRGVQHRTKISWLEPMVLDPGIFHHAMDHGEDLGKRKKGFFRNENNRGNLNCTFSKVQTISASNLLDIPGRKFIVFEIPFELTQSSVIMQTHTNLSKPVKWIVCNFGELLMNKLLLKWLFPTSKSFPTTVSKSSRRKALLDQAQNPFSPGSCLPLWPTSCLWAAHKEERKACYFPVPALLQVIFRCNSCWTSKQNIIIMISDQKTGIVRKNGW